jgi:hypothetical protein
MVNSGSGYERSHFFLSEFQNAEGLAIVHPSLLLGLENLRDALCTAYETEVPIVITCGTRTQADNEKLAEKLGWTTEGGAVSRESKHLPKYGGVAADIYAMVSKKENPDGIRVPQHVIEYHAKKYFSYVKADYPDGHVHVDQWDREQQKVAWR